MSFVSSLLRSVGGGSKPQEFVQPAQNKGLTVSIGRLFSNFQNFGHRKGDYKEDPSDLPVSKNRTQLELNTELEKAAKRISQLENVVTAMTKFNLPFEKAYNKEDEKLLKEMCPGLFLTQVKEEQLTLLQNGLDQLIHQRDGLFHEIVRWTFLQPDGNPLPMEHVFPKITEVLAQSMGRFKTNDPTIPFLKSAVQERAQWHLESFQRIDESSLAQFFILLQGETTLIFKQIPEGYYNNFMGAGNSKVEANRRNGNDFAKIEDADIIKRIIQLQLEAAADFLAPSVEDRPLCSQILEKCFLGQELDVTESLLISGMVRNWQAAAGPQPKVVLLQYYIDNAPHDLDPESPLAKDLQEYITLTERASAIKRDAPANEHDWRARTTQIVLDRKSGIARIDMLSQKCIDDYVKLGLYLDLFPADLDESIASLRAKVATLEIDVTQATVLKSIYEMSLSRAQKKLAKKAGVAAQRAAAVAALIRTQGQLSTLGIERKQVQAELQQAKTELVKGPARLREAMDLQLQAIKLEQDRLAQKSIQVFGSRI